MALVINNRVRETTATTGTGAVTLAGAVDGFQTFAAGIGNDNTTYYAISLNTSSEWEVGLGTLNADSSTLTRTTVLESSNSDSAVDFSAGSKEIFCTLPSEKAVYLDASGDPVPAQISFKEGGTDFTNSLLVGHSTTGTLSAAQQNVGVGITALDALTSGDQNTAVGYGAGSAINSGLNDICIGHSAGALISSGQANVAIGYRSLDAVTTTHYNTAVGHQSLSACTGDANVGVGTDAGLLIAGGDNNICLGYHAGNNITSGSGNVVIGYADVSSATGDDQLSISDGEDGAVVWVTGESTGNVEINEVWNPSLSTTGKALIMGF
jgi:hypothetical protein